MSQRGPQPTILPPTRYTVENCTSVSIYCPVDLTIYGFAPNMGANTFFVAFFGLCALIQLVLGIKYKTWTYMIGLAIGSAAEALGTLTTPSQYQPTHLLISLQAMSVGSCSTTTHGHETASISRSPA